MTPTILFIAFAALLFILLIRKYFLMRSLKHYSPADVAEKIRNSNVILLDVRTNGERSSQHIGGSVHIPLHEIDKRADELTQYQAKEIICYCRSGNRSISAAAKLQKKGFDVANLKGGIIAWNLHGLK